MEMFIRQDKGGNLRQNNKLASDCGMGAYVDGLNNKIICKRDSCTIFSYVELYQLRIFEVHQLTLKQHAVPTYELIL